MKDELSAADRDFLAAARVGHLATADAGGVPHVIPVCYAVVDRRTLVFAIDDKPKRSARPIKRLRNLAENPRFALVVDRWDEDWARLGYVLVAGSGRICAEPASRERAVAALRARYPQYVAMGLDARRHPVVELAVETVHRWGAVGQPS
jgi:PPOX class probable F420-dependent enzyme